MEAATTHESEYLSRNFKRKELECPCCGKCEMNPVLITRLQALRDILGFPLVITSGYRCESHNREVGGVARSQHLLGNAVDVKVRGMSGDDRYRMIKLSFDLRFSGVGLGSYYHLDVRKKNRSIWVYRT